MKKTVFRRLVSGLLCLLLMGMYIPAVNAQTGDSLFLDDFSAPNSRWSAVAGQMTVQNGVARFDGTDAIKQTNPDADVQVEHQYASVDGVGKDVTITVKVKPITLAAGKEERIGIIAHTKGGGEGDTKWCALLSQGKLYLLEEAISWRGETPFAYSVGNTYLMKVMVQKNKLSAKVWQEGNPEPAEWMLQSTFTTQLDEDGVGLYYANSVVEFDDFLVQQSPESPPALVIDRVKPGNVFTEGETPALRVKLDNSTNVNTQGSYTVNYNVTDYLGQPVDSGSCTIDVTPGTAPTADIALSNITQKGSYGIEITMKSGDTVIDRKTSSIALIDAVSSGLTQESHFGIGSYGGFLGSRFDEQKLADSYTMMEKMGVKWTREEIFWDEMRPTKDSQYTWGKFDQTVVQAREHHINIMGLVDYWANWSIPYDNDPNRNVDWPTAIANFKQYATDVATRYMPGGDLAKEKGWNDGYGITSWEIWNEPPTFWSGTAEQFGQVVKAASEGIRSVDPNAFIVSSNQDDTFDKTVLDVAGADAYKALAIHIYPGAVNPDASEFPRIIREKRAFLDSNGAPDKQIWITETGWSTVGQVTPLQQAQNIVRSNILTIAAGVDKIFTFTFNYNNSSEGWGVVEENLDPKASYSAYSAMTHRLEGKQFANELTMGSAVKGFVFANSSTSTTTLWTTRGTAGLSITPPEGVTYRTYDFMGNLVGQYTNTFDISLSESPIYLEADGVASQDMANTVQNGIIAGMDTVDIAISDLSDLPIAGKHPTIDVTVTNNINVSQQGMASIELPEGWRVKNKTVKFNSIAPQDSQIITFELVEFKKHSDGQYPLEIRVQTDKGRTVKKVNLYLTAAQRLTPVIDGSNTEWTGQLKVQLDTPDKVVGIVGWAPSNLSADASTAWDDQYFYLNVEATDNVHNQPHNGWSIWEGDSVQFFFDPNNDKLDSGNIDDVQYGAAVSNDGTVVFINYTTGQVADNLKGTVVRDEAGKKTIYEIAVPWSELKVTPLAGMKMGFNFMLNDNDGAGRTGWINWKEGIGNSYNPSKWSSWELTSQLKQTIRLGVQEAFVDDFNEINPAWNVMGGTFEIREGYAVTNSEGLTDYDRNMSYAFIDDMPLDSIITTRFTIDKMNVPGESRIGILSKTADDNSTGGPKWDSILWGGSSLCYYQEDGGWPGDITFPSVEGKTYNFKVDVEGLTVKTKVWEDGTTEPVDWQLNGAFSSMPQEDGIGLYFAAASVKFHEFKIEPKNTEPPVFPPDFQVSVTELTDIDGNLITMPQAGQYFGVHLKVTNNTEAPVNKNMVIEFYNDAEKAVKKDREIESISTFENVKLLSGENLFRAGFIMPDVKLDKDKKAQYKVRIYLCDSLDGGFIPPVDAVEKQLN